MKFTKKLLMILILICFLFNSTILYAGDFSSVDQFLNRKSEIVQQWMQSFKESIEKMQQWVKQDSSLFRDLLNKDAYWDKAKKSLDFFFENNKDTIEDFKKDYDKARGIREM